MTKLVLRTETRPWGEFREFVKNAPATVKIISVKAGEAFSLQKHEKRGEFWRVLSGTPEITVGESSFKAKKGDEFTIKVGENHRIAALDSDAEILEISTGQFNEDDIIRIEDKYGRT